MKLVEQDITNRRFSKLVAIRPAPPKFYPNTGRTRAMWWCLCDCGKEIAVKMHSLLDGHSKSCGCGKKPHGMSGTRLYRIWVGMICRCHDPNNHAYQTYGAVGIAVCEQWRENFIPFRDWSLSNGYRDDLTIDRRDNGIGYSPANCRWATRIEQGNNTSRNRWVTFNGVRDTVAGWSRRTGIGYATIYARVYLGWSISDSILKPVATKERQNP